MEELIAITQKEIERRDEELSELRRIVEQQSSAREGMAVGAAAIAQLLDSDELVRQETGKTEGASRRVGTKARQVEIELSENVPSSLGNAWNSTREFAAFLPKAPMPCRRGQKEPTRQLACEAWLERATKGIGTFRVDDTFLEWYCPR